MTSPLIRRAVLGAAAVGMVATAVVAAPALATSPSYPVVCAGAQAEAPRNTTTTFTLSCEDTEGGPVDSYVVLTQPTKDETFTVDAVTGEVSYRPVAGADGTDTFTFKGVVDGLGESAPATAVITLGNERPVCADVEPLSVGHDASVVVPLVCDDADGDPLTVSTGTTGAAHGSVTVGTEVVYTPAAGYTGTDSFSLRAGDGDLLSEEVVVDVTVTNARPTCAGGALSTVHDRKRTFPLLCVDADGDALTRSVVSRAQHGTVTVTGASVTYRPAAGYVGKDTFTLGATDGLAASVPARFTVTVTNAVPTCTAGRTGKSLVVRAGKRLALHPVCKDADGDVLRVVVAQPRRGDMVRKASGWFYVAPKRWAGRETFRISCTDGVATSAAVTYRVKVTPRRR